jgi:hypothetical protein
MDKELMAKLTPELEERFSNVQKAALELLRQFVSGDKISPELAGKFLGASRATVYRFLGGNLYRPDADQCERITELSALVTRLVVEWREYLESRAKRSRAFELALDPEIQYILGNKRFDDEKKLWHIVSRNLELVLAWQAEKRKE